MPITLRERRVGLDLTQKELASRAAISERSYRFVEAGKREPGVQTAIRIADELQITDYQDFKALFLRRQPEEQKDRITI